MMHESAGEDADLTQHLQSSLCISDVKLWQSQQQSCDWPDLGQL